MHDKIEQNGITFTRLKAEHLEIVRTWRNSDYVKSKMIFQENITAEMQHNWFLQVNNNQNYYFIVEYKNEKVGVANIKDIQEGQGEPGFYLCKQELEDTGVAALVSVALADFGFGALNLNKFYIHVLSNNQKAIKYNLFLGYKIIAEKSSGNISYLELDKEAYINKIKKLRTYLTTV